MINLPLERNEALLMRALLDRTETSLRGYSHGTWSDIPIADELKNIRERLEAIIDTVAERLEAMRAQAAVR